jgi:hypothetical protein
VAAARSFSTCNADSGDTTFKHDSPVSVLFHNQLCVLAPLFTVVPQRGVACCPGDALVDLSQERTPVHSLSNSHVHTGAFLRFPSKQLIVFILGVNLLGACDTSFNTCDARRSYKNARENNRVCREAALSGPSLHAARVTKHMH